MCAYLVCGQSGTSPVKPPRLVLSVSHWSVAAITIGRLGKEDTLVHSAVEVNGDEEWGFWCVCDGETCCAWTTGITWGRRNSGVWWEQSVCASVCASVCVCVCACVCMCMCVCVCACHVSLNMETSTVFQYDSISLFCNINSLLRNVLPCAYTCTCVHVYVLRSQKISNTQWSQRVSLHDSSRRTCSSIWLFYCGVH